MGSSSSDSPAFASPAPVDPFERPPLSPWSVERPRSSRRWRHLILFLLTAVSTTWAGSRHWAYFELDLVSRPIDVSTVALFLRGLWYSGSILAILGAHELGHYFACRYYRVDATLPYFLPAPLPLTGTLGAFIRIRQPIPGKRALFDIGIAGPLAGFIVAVPLLFIGINLSRMVRLPTDFQGIALGEPLMFRLAEWLFWGPTPDGYSLNMHPMAFAAWFGLLATALNLFPIGQLDGGHISYAVLGRKSTGLTFATVLCLIGLTFVSSSWLVWTVLTVMMLLAFGPRHPRTFDEDLPLDRIRLVLAALALLMFVLCFTPAPIEPFDIVGTKGLGD